MELKLAKVTGSPRSYRDGGFREVYDRSTRVYVSVEGESVMENFMVNRRNHDPKTLKPLVAEAVQAFVDDNALCIIDRAANSSSIIEEVKLNWAQKCGCSCGCSPGFNLSGRIVEKQHGAVYDLHVTYELVLDKTERDEALQGLLEAARDNYRQCEEAVEEANKAYRSTRAYLAGKIEQLTGEAPDFDFDIPELTYGEAAALVE